MKNNNKIEKLYLTGEVYILAFAVLGVVLIFSDFWIGVIQLSLAVISLVLNFILKKISRKRLNAMIEKVTMDAGDTSSNALLSFPLPIALLDAEGAIRWYNTEFRDIFPGRHLSECSVLDLFPEFNKGLLRADDENNGFICELKSGDKVFKAIGNTPQASEENKPMTLLYLEDITEEAEIQKKYISEKTFECLVFVDNYDELMESTPSAYVPQLQAQIYKEINDWTAEHSGMLIKYEKDKYFIIFEYRHLEQFIKNKFEILNKIRSISEKNTIPATVSIGIGLNGQTLSENDTFAKNAINMALGRGGDQVVMKDNEQFRFYGGSTKEHEKSTRVKARVVSFALSGLVNNAENVIVLTHKNADVDGFGAAFGIYRICRIHNRPINICMETYDKTVANMITRLENSEEYDGLIITASQAAARINQNTLIVVVDTHKTSLLEAPALLKPTKQIVIVDHHRRSADFIEHTALVYHEPYASSACEMVTEILQYTTNKMSLTKLEAEALYSGIVVDTKNFTFKTGVRTFEAASFLRRQGVDTVAVKTMFQQDLQSYVKRSDIIRNSTIIRDNIAVSIAPKSDESTHIIAAQAADELLNIKGIIASFVIFNSNDGVAISGRSLGGINVQVILEKLGGGGHLTIAGAQLPGTSAEEAKQQLLAAIDEYYLESTN
ncbi:DHH family phosphoesterase [Congzhengia sp.]|uniref:DHH family phosphoesterase n=1 Tax=Congzhengia sp. TaxID=2944168 RepID=UPI003077A362